MWSGLGPKAILLDLDGTLADSLSVMNAVYRQFMEKFGREPSDAEFCSLNGPPLSEVVRRLKLSHALACHEEELLCCYMGLIDLAYASVAPSPGVESLLQLAKQNHCMTAIVTSNSRKRTTAWLERVCLSDMVDFIVADEDVKHGKPNPEPYIRASHLVRCSLTDIVAIEDSPQGAKSAVDAGLRTLVLSEGKSAQWPQGVEHVASLVRAAERLWPL